ncbi:MAG: hypothetical protein CMH50_09745 [Myxococcales bacterium]|nr:hypothetical protein [Myxococcales bacterium]
MRNSPIHDLSFFPPIDPGSELNTLSNMLISLLTSTLVATQTTVPKVTAPLVLTAKRAKRRRTKRRQTKPKPKATPASPAENKKPQPAASAATPKPARTTKTSPRPGKGDVNTPLRDQRQSMAAFALASDEGLSETVAALLEEVMLTTLRGSGRFQSILGGSDLAAMLSLDQQRTALGCESADCATAFQEALGVPFLAVPKIGRVGDRFLVNLKIMDTSEGRVLARIHRMVQAETSLPAALQSVTKQAISMMFGEPVQLQELEDPAVVEARRRKAILRNTGLAFSLGGLGLVSYSYAAMAEARSLLPPPGHRTTQQDVSSFASASASADLTWGLGAAVTAAGLTAFALGW